MNTTTINSIYTQVSVKSVKARAKVNGKISLNNFAVYDGGSIGVWDTIARRYVLAQGLTREASKRIMALS